MAEGTINHLSKYVHRLTVTETTSAVGSITLDLYTSSQEPHYVLGAWCEGEWAINIPTLVDGRWRIFIYNTNLQPMAGKSVTLYIYYI